ncbi:MAG: DUF1778 domain-containing protein [Rhizobiaceae bacterium]
MTQAAKRDVLNIRIKADDRNLIDRAARAKGKNRTDFILDAARAAAEEALIDRSLIEVSREDFDAFVARLDEEPRPNERLVKMLHTPAPWEKT